MRLLVRMSLRYLLGHRWQSGLAILGVALGVAVVVGVDLANASARKGFELSTRAISGGATHQILGPATGFDERLYAELVAQLGIRRSAPVVEGFVQRGDRTWRLLGIDPLAELAQRDKGWHLRRNLLKFMTEPGAVFMNPDDAHRLGLAPGQVLPVQVGGRSRTLRIRGTINGGGSETEGLLVADISTAQEVFGKVGRLDRIDMVLTPDQVERVRRWLPQGLTLIPRDRRMAQTGRMTRAFHQDLGAMSLLALVVGAFLIYSTMVFAVVSRRPLLGTLRMLGVTRGTLFALVLGEAALIGLLGTGLGLVGGIMLSHELVHLVTRTINDLYYVLTVTDVTLDGASLAKSAALGLIATLLGASLPAWEAMSTGPAAARRRSTLERRVQRVVPWMAALGSLTAAAGAGILAVTQRGLVSGFGGLLLLVLGFALAIPLLVAVLAHLAAWIMGHRWRGLGRLALRGVEAGLSRSGIAVAALAIAVAASLGIGVSVASFRATVEQWLGQTLQSDIYISAPDSVSSEVGGTLSPRVMARLGQLAPGAHMHRMRRVQVQSTFGAINLLAMDMGPHAARGYRMKAGSTGAWAAARRQHGVLVSESFAYRHRLGVGDRLNLTTAHGVREFAISGIFYDYGSPKGLLIMPLARYRSLWEDTGISSVGLSLGGLSSNRALHRIKALLAGTGQQVLVRPNREIRRLSLEIFDRTFAITAVLRWLALGVAFVGIFSALMALQLERRKEHAILRATGVTTGELFGVVTLETLFMGTAAGLLALPLGLLMAEVLITVINRRSFGWTMEIAVPGAMLLQSLLLAAVAALLAGLYPAWRISRTVPADALREE